MNSTKKEIIYTSIELFKMEGYSNVSLRQICNSWGITKGTFYYHFNSKDDLLNAINGFDFACKINNREKIEKFSWIGFVEKIMNIC